MTGPRIDRRQWLLAAGVITVTPRLVRAMKPGEFATRPVRTRTECIDRPMGLEVARPRFSWALESSDRNVRQRAYRLAVASDPKRLSARKADLWDSGRVESDRCFDVPYEGRALRSGERAWWRVLVWDHHDRLSAPSEAAWFEMGLLGAGAWRARWLAIEGAGEKADRVAGLRWIWGARGLDPRPQKFRFRCSLAAKPAHADLFVAAKDDLLGVWVNGGPVPVRAKPFWGTMLRLPLELLAGTNVICVSASADVSGFFPPEGGALAALMKVTDRDGRVTRFTTGADWRTSNADDERWNEPAFDDRGWPAAVISSANTRCEPWPAQPAMLARREFYISKTVERARLYATALGAYEALINGQKAGEARLAPEITVASDHVLYQCYDVTNLVKTGPNAIGALIGDGWFASAFTWHNQRYALGEGPRRFLAQLVLDYADGSTEVVATDSQWRTAESAVRSSEIYNGEEYDARAESAGWDLAGFDDRRWATCELGQVPSVRLMAQIGPAIRETRTLSVVRALQPRPGVLVCDFGQNFSGWCRLKVQGAAGTTVQLRYAEILQETGEVDTANLRGAKATDRYTLRGDAAGEIYEPHFTYHGFRYVEITGFPQTLAADSLVGVVVHTDAAVTGHFVAQHETVQALWEHAFWSQRSNFFGVPTDCPQRDERMGWMGDIQVFLDAASFNMDVDAFIRRFMAEVRAGQTPDGAFPIVTPQPLAFPELVTAGWSDAGVILPWTLYRRYGETRVIEENWQAMERWLTYIASANPDFIWRNRRGLDLGDWLSVDATKPDDETSPRILVATAYWAYCASLMEEMAGATNRPSDANRYADMRSRIGSAFARAFVADDGTVGNGSQTSHVLALRFELVPAKVRPLAGDLLAADIRRRGMKLSTGFLGTPYLLDVLADTGHADVAVSLLLQTGYPSWGYMVAKGATTMWERWNGDVGDVAMNSYNHYAFGAVVGFMYRRLAGIAPAEPGFRRIEINPLFDSRIGRVRASYDSCVGRISTDVSGDAQGLSRLAVDIPPNTVARVHLPPRDQMWREGGRALEGRADLKIVSRDGSGLVVEAGSGRYEFTAA
ncbi:MAG: alpha-L-rhamnosidase [Gammaproteobacteria bacterium]|nr:alpha-L-rhamnosidase [Gammaproteobacteria bacterium]